MNIEFKAIAGTKNFNVMVDGVQVSTIVHGFTKGYSADFKGHWLELGTNGESARLRMRKFIVDYPLLEAAEADAEWKRKQAVSRAIDAAVQRERDGWNK